RFSMNDDLSVRFLTSGFAKDRYAALDQVKTLGGKKLGFWNSENNSTASTSVYPLGLEVPEDIAPANVTFYAVTGWEVPQEMSRALQFEHLEGLFYQVSNVVQPVGAAGTMIINRTAGEELASRYVGRLREENTKLEDRVESLEGELERFRPY